ncbi:MAG: alpha-2-macroglobulin, partial [Acidobacteria bacterium]
KWGASQGIVERFGPQTVPVEGRGQERFDLRIHPIKPLDRSYWCFPDRPIIVDESKRPPGPGEEPKPHTVADADPSPQDIAAQISNLGSPPVSSIVTLPLRREGKSALFGLDLAPFLETIGGKNQPGTYLVGLRNLSANGNRSWMRVQVTDLCLTTVEEPAGVRFQVTSLRSGEPVAAASVRVEGTQKQSGRVDWTVLAQGSTDAQGAFVWAAPGYRQNTVCVVKRIVVAKDSDLLVLDAAQAPDKYADNQWSKDRRPWLQWAFQELAGRASEPETLTHIFTERPVYRPEEEVHIKGYLRRQEKGHLHAVKMDGWVVIEGPGELVWRYPATLTGQGSFYARFLEKDRPTGAYRASFEDQERRNRYGSVPFQIEAYRIPRFEVALHSPDQAALDKEFQVSLSATYYAGGRVSGQPVQWRVTQFPYTWTPAKLEGFHYSSDSRYSSGGTFQSTPRIERDDKTSESGGASIVLNPAIEPTAQPRTYIVEATVTGPDDQTVTATRSIVALPPFVLGLKAPRFLERATEITPEIVAVGMDGKLVADKPITVRLLRREWHSHLRASDFSDGVGRYITDVVDNKMSESTVRSGSEPLAIKLPIDKSGVYIIELEAHDRLDRAQVVRVDLYAGGPEAITWAKPVSRVFSVATDKPRYDPGNTASIVLKSPFQEAQALAVIEAPEGNQYRWLKVSGGAAVFQMPIQGHYVPRIPVHFILMRGRLAGTAPQPGNLADLGKPTTMAATAWLEVSPLARQVQVELNHPKSASPGQRIEVAITLKDPGGQPLPGEVTLWLVDQAVLALGKERRLDPVPDFLASVSSHLSVHDSRNLAFGALAFAENPGGDGGESEDLGLLDRATVRKNFKSVPYFNPAILVGPEGKAVVTVQLSDDLTNFKLRAKVASGEERFGFGTGHLEVR